MATKSQPIHEIKTKYHYGAGLDIHKYYVTACVVVDKDRAIEKLGVQEFKKTPEGLEQMCRFLQKYLLETIVMEATGVYTQVVKDKLDACTGWGAFKPHVVVIHPAQVKKYLGELHQDKADALDLARLGVVHMAKESYIPRDTFRELRGLTREIRFIEKDCTRIKNRLHRILAQWGLVLNDFDISSSWGFELCCAIVDVPGNFGAVLDAIESGKVGLSKTSKLAIMRRLNQYKAFVNIKIPRAALVSLKSYLLELSFNKTIIDRLTTEAERAIQENPIISKQIIRLAAIPGVSEIGAASIISEVGDVFRFPSRKQFLQYVGCAPTLHQSGEKTTHGHLSKRVNIFAKTMFFISGKAVCLVVKADSDLKEYARKQMNAHWNTKKLAWANTGIKIARIVYALLRNDGEYYASYESTTVNGINNPAPIKKECKISLTSLRNKTRHYVQFVKKVLGNDADAWSEKLREHLDKLFDKEAP